MDNIEIEARKLWLTTLKAGDKVCVESYGTMGKFHDITTINKLTPTGQFRIGAYLFNKDGERREGWSHFIIIPATDEIRQGIKDRNVRREVKKIDFNTLSQDKINRIYAILKEE